MPDEPIKPPQTGEHTVPSMDRSTHEAAPSMGRAALLMTMFSLPLGLIAPLVLMAMFAGRVPSPGAAQAVAHVGDVEEGLFRYLESCSACHGWRAQGMPRAGVSLRDSRFVAEQTDEDLLFFLVVGRSPADPRSVANLPMPPRGGNANLTEAELRNIVWLLRAAQTEVAHAPRTAGGGR